MGACSVSTGSFEVCKEDRTYFDFRYMDTGSVQIASDVDDRSKFDHLWSTGWPPFKAYYRQRALKVDLSDNANLISNVRYNWESVIC